MDEELLSAGTEVYVTADVLDHPVNRRGVITQVMPGSPHPYGVSLDNGVYVRAAVACVFAPDATSRGIGRIERARKIIRRRQGTERRGGGWTPGEDGMEHPRVTGPAAQAVLDYSDDGTRYQVNGYTYDGHHLYRQEFAMLDAALRNGTRVANDGPTPDEHVGAWNLTYPEGQAVRYWTGAREGVGTAGETRSRAEVLSGHTAVVWVTGHDACIALTHVQPVHGTEG